MLRLEEEKGKYIVNLNEFKTDVIYSLDLEKYVCSLFSFLLFNLL